MINYSIKEIKQMLDSEVELDSSLMRLLQEDERKGVQRLLIQHNKKLMKKEALLQAHIERLQFEQQLKNKPGIQFIAGIDEVGRGPLAGPVVAASVILPEDTDKFIGINDSKTLSKKSREIMAKIITENAIAFNIIEIDNYEIDKDNILNATKKAMIESVKGLPINPHCLLIDALKINIDIPQIALINGDQRSLSIAAASIIAKVHRDKLMRDYAKMYPEFGFDRNAGYGTKEHLQALEDFGYTPIHRRSFAPIKAIKFKYSN